jgi:hypothetical protein
MYIENNVFENIFNTVIDVKGRTKDNIKAIMNISFFCHCKNIKLVYDGLGVVKLKASFILDMNTQLLVYQWLKSLCFSDEHALNISRLVNLEDCISYGMKSCDCHVFMQIPIPLAYQDLLPKKIWDELLEISNFFRAIYFNKLQT